MRLLEKTALRALETCLLSAVTPYQQAADFCVSPLLTTSLQ